jgi:hypothetical protein
MTTTITNTGGYTLDSSITPIAALPGQFHIKLQTRLESAKNPEDPRTVFQCTVDLDGLILLAGCIHAALGATPDSALLASCKELLSCIQPDRDWHEAKRARAAIRSAEGRQS